MKALTQFIAEKQNFLINKRINNKISSSSSKLEYFPKRKNELITLINNLFDRNITDLNCIDTSEITDMSKLFANVDLDKFKKSDFSQWDVSNVEDMSLMFRDCHNIPCDLSNWNVSKVKNMSFMFSECALFNGCGIDSWDVSNVQDMSYMFTNCENFDGNEIANWNVSNVNNMEDIFYNCTMKIIPNWYWYKK